jgi:hypothetical protein
VDDVSLTHPFRLDRDGCGDDAFCTVSRAKKGEVIDAVQERNDHSPGAGFLSAVSADSS